MTAPLRWLVLAAALLAPARAIAAPEVVWTIGRFDRSSGEFAGPQEIVYSDPKRDPVFTVGTSAAARDWQGYQPGPANGLAGGRVHPFTIHFALKGAPRGVYHLRIAMLFETQRLSHLRVRVNEKSGTFFFHPLLDYAAGDWQGTFVPQTSAAEKTIDIPAAWLREGANTLVLEALDEPAAAENVLGAITTGHTGIVYDALELSRDPRGAVTGALTARATPTLFYKGRGARETEVVEVILAGAVPRAAAVTLVAGRRRARAEVPGGADFGEVRVRLDVPSWTGTVTGTLEVAAKGGAPTRFPVELAAGKRWTVMVVPHEHLDIGFTDQAARVAELHARSLDDAMGLMKRVPEFRWTPDGFWVIEQYLAGRSPARVKALLAALRRGAIALPAASSNQHTGTASLEGLVQSLADSHRFARAQRLPAPTTAHITDVPSYSWSYASVLADAGIKYLVAGSNGWRAPAVLLGRWNEKSPFYWEGPDGGRVLMWYSRAYLQLHTLFGSPPSLAAIEDALPVFLQAYTRPDYRSDAAIIFGSQLENTPLAPEQADLARRFAARFSWPRLELATFDAAMRRVEKGWRGAPIPVHRGDFGPYWEDGFGSDALHTAIHRRNQQRTLAAEQLAALPRALDPSLRPDEERLRRLWRNILRFDEHTWTFVLATTQPDAQQTTEQIALKRSQVIEARKDLDETVARGFEQLSGQLGPKDGSIIVWNSLGWKRSAPAEVNLPDGFEIHDRSGAAVPYDVVRVGSGKPLPGFGGGFRRVRFLATDVPAVGYRLYALALGGGGAPAPRAAQKGDVFESPHYRVTVDAASGGLRSVLDKELGIELVDPAQPLGAVLYVTGADDAPRNSLYRFGAGLAPPRLTTTRASGGKLVSVEETRLGTVLHLRAHAPNLPAITTDITLRRDRKQIDLRVTLDKKRVLTKEAVYVAFPFALAAPSFAYATQNGWVNPAVDELAGGSREWYAAHAWSAVRSAKVIAAVVPIDAPLVAFGDIVRGRWPAAFAPKSSAIFSYAMNNYWGTNFVAWQGGRTILRYAVTSARALDPAALARAGAEAMTPLEVSSVPAGGGAGGRLARPLPDEGSFLELRGADVTLTALRSADDGRGVIVRVVETAGKAGTLALSSPLLRVASVRRTSVLEDDRGAVPVSGGVARVPVKPHEIVTLRLLLAPGGHR